MSEINKYPSISSNNKSKKITIASGPVIIEDNKVLLDKHGNDTFWKFPGGKISDSESLQNTAIREAKEELGIEITLLDEPIIFSFESEDEYIILFHYPATITSGKPSPSRDVREWSWHDIANLPTDIAPNIKTVLNELTR